MYELKFHITPKAYCRPRFAKGRTYNLKAYTDYKLALEFMAMNQFKGELLDGPLHVDYIFNVKRPKKSTHPYPSRSDLDNYIKAVNDALNETVWKDDSQIVSMNACKAWDSEDSIIIEICSGHELLKAHC